MRIEEQISELLFEHDCVIVPDFGGFVCNYASARIDPVKHLFEPPSKRIIFNKGLTRNDGLLAHYISDRFKLNYVQATDIIGKEVKRYKENIEKEKRLILENIGQLYTDEKGNLLFQQDNKINYLVESYGLPSFYYLPPAEEGDFGKRIVEKKSNIVRIYASAAIVTVLVASVFWFALMEKQSNLRFSSLNFFSKKELSEYAFAPSTYKNLPQPVFEPFKVVITNTPEPAMKSNTTPISTNNLPIASTKYFSVIVGSFAEKENADNLIKQFNKQNVSLSIIGRNPQGLYLVGYGKFNSHYEAVEKRDILFKNSIKGAWIKAF